MCGWSCFRGVGVAVIINLGTNDFSTQPNPDKAVFIEAYVALIARIQKSHPHAQIFAVCGPMIGQPVRLLSLPSCVR